MSGVFSGLGKPAVTKVTSAAYPTVSNAPMAASDPRNRIAAIASRRLQGGNPNNGGGRGPSHPLLGLGPLERLPNAFHCAKSGCVEGAGAGMSG